LHGTEAEWISGHSSKDSNDRRIGKAGHAAVQMGFDKKIAEKANVSALRVGKFFLRDVEGGVDVIFVIAEPSGVTPAKTVDFKTEIPVQAATETFNKTMEKDLEFVVQGVGGNKTYTIASQSLKTLAETWNIPQPPAPAGYSGYTGGSMFVLGLFMFIFGAAAGVGGVYLLWRRRHMGGLAYQVFE